MIDFDDVLCDVYDLHDEELKRLRDEISKEIQKREKKREVEAAEKVAKAIQDYLAAGYPIHIRGNVIFYTDGYEHDCDFISEVFGIQNNDGEIILDVEERCLD